MKHVLVLAILMATGAHPGRAQPSDHMSIGAGRILAENELLTNRALDRPMSTRITNGCWATSGVG